MADVTQYTSLITSQHRSRPKFMAMVAMTTQPMVDTQNLLDTLPGLFDIDEAVGDQLDVLGQWIGSSRNLTVPLASVFFSFQPNLVPDPANVNGTWIHHGVGLQSTQTGAGWEQVGNGAQQADFWSSPGIPVVPGQSYVIAGYIDASQVVASNPSIDVYNNTMGNPNYSTSGLITLNQRPGIASMLQETFVVPVGVTNVVVVVNSFQAITLNGKLLRFRDVSLQGTPALGWGQGTWFSPFDKVSGLVVLPDDSYRILLLSVIASNQWDGTVPGAYLILDLLYQLSGFKILIQDNQDMSISVILFANQIDAVFKAMLQNGLIAMRPAGVSIAGYFKATTPVFAWGIDTLQMSGWGSGNWIQLTNL